MTNQLKINSRIKSLIYLLILVTLFCIPLIYVVSLISFEKQITPNDEFFTNSLGFVPEIDISTWELTIDGHVEEVLTFTYSDLKLLPNKELVATLQCVEGPSGTALWRGVSVKYLLDLAKVRPGAIDVVFYAVDGYSSSLTLDNSRADDVLLAYEMNDELLPANQGFPVRVVAPNHIGYKWVKWVVRVEVVDYDYIGYWEKRGFADDGRLTPLNDWVIHALLFSISFLFGGLTLASGLKFTQNNTIFKDLPKVISTKFHGLVSIVYVLLSIVTFIFWIVQAYNFKAKSFYSFHGVSSLVSIVFLIIGSISGFTSVKKSERNTTWHSRISLLTLYIFFITMFLGLLLSFGIGFLRI
jgi:hypothetical protein